MKSADDLHSVVAAPVAVTIHTIEVDKDKIVTVRRTRCDKIRTARHKR